MVQQTNIRTLNLPRKIFHMKLHSVFDSDVCCFNEVITIPEILVQIETGAFVCEERLFDQING